MKAQRNTVQRQIILDALINLNTHPTIDEVYLEIRKKHPFISKMTVYRNLRRLAEDGVIRQVSLPDASERYDGRIMQHYHFKCRKCGSIINIDIDYIPHLNSEVREKYGYQVDHHDVIFTGICEKCKAAEDKTEDAQKNDNKK